MDEKTGQKAEAQGTAGTEPPKVLSASEKEILNRQLNGLPAELKATSLLSYTTTFDIVLIVISVASAIIAGGLNPLLTVNPYSQ